MSLRFIITGDNDAIKKIFPGYNSNHDGLQLIKGVIVFEGEVYGITVSFYGDAIWRSEYNPTVADSLRVKGVTAVIALLGGSTTPAEEGQFRVEEFAKGCAAEGAPSFLVNIDEKSPERAQKAQACLSNLNPSITYLDLSGDLQALFPTVLTHALKKMPVVKDYMVASKLTSEKYNSQPRFFSKEQKSQDWDFSHPSAGMIILAACIPVIGWAYLVYVLFNALAEFCCGKDEENFCKAPNVV